MPLITPPQYRFGMLPPSQRTREQNRLTERIIESSAPFFIAAQTRATDGARVLLWEATKKVNRGKHLPTLRQQVGSCVGHGGDNAVQYLQCWEIIRKGDREKWRPTCEPYFYGTMRRVGGFRISGDGGVGAWMAEAVKQFGVLPADAKGVPATPTVSEDTYGTTVSWPGSLDQSWGRRPGPPEELVNEGRKHLVQTYAQVRNYLQVRDAIANGYPVTVASMQGFQMKPVVDKGKHWGRASGSWAHQMCFVGVDDDSSRPGCYLLNSWGADAHGKPAGDEPPGGFWVDAEVVDRMTGQDDSFAFSQFNGFPEQLDFMLI